MSGSENGMDNSVKADGDAERIEIQRAASPAKRSAGEMEGTGKSENSAEQQDSYEDVAMAGTSTDLYDQDTGANSAATSAPGTMTTNTSATSFQSDEQPPPYSANGDRDGDEWKVRGGASVPSLDEQVQEVMQMAQKPVQHGERGNVVSARWLERVLSRTSENQNSTEYSKTAREGDIGPVDNSDIVTPDAFNEPILHDINGHEYIPLKQGLTMDEDFQVLPDDAWGKILSWYGIASGQKQITRYAHDTAPEGANMTNVVYELDPPVFLVRKFPQPVDDPETKEQAKNSLTELRLKRERQHRGQMKPEDALMVVSSRQEKGQKFLARVKDFAGIPISHKVQIWRVLKPTNIAVDEPDNAQPGIASPPLSPSTSPSPGQAERTKLIVDASDWQKMEIGKDIELIDMKDQTGNPNYNGSSTIETFSLFENQTLILEEQTRGPAGGEYSSDQKKKILSIGKINGSKPASTNNSRRSSPAPSGTIITRSRRRDGKTRGTVGLSNLGNTCYMNSALQCIRSVEELAIYFLQDKYKEEINASNVLGSGGIMAKKYAEVLNGIYGDNASSSFSPNNFKKTLSQQNPVFSGWGQQDSQEFLSYLVDSIHEDLNRIQKKPYLENPDSDDARVTDPEYIKELGDTYRSNHAQRNESVCMDLFSGFYKNTMECPVCDKVSVTFDPFASLTLQLPIESTIMHNFTFVPLNGTPMNHNLDLEKNLTVKDIKKIIASKHENVDANKLWMVEVYSHKIYKHFSDRTTVAEANIQANDYIFVYELADVPTNIPPPQRSSGYSSYSYGKRAEEIPEMDSEMAEDFAVPIFHRKKNRFGNGWDVTMHPQYVTIKRDQAQDYNSVLKKVLRTVAQVTSRSILTEDVKNERSGSPETENAESNGDADTAQDDTARVSDHSVASEDGYVSVSVEGGNGDAQANGQVNGGSGEGNVKKGAKIPTGFFESSYEVPAALRDQLFTLNYARGHENMFCTGTTGFDEKSVRNMHARVKRNLRRSSTDSSMADETSNATPSSPDGNADEDEESDEDEEMSVQQSTEDSPAPPGDMASETGNDDLPEDPLTMRRRGNGKENKFKGNKTRKNKEKKPSKKEKREMKKARARVALGSPQSQRSANITDAQDDETFYIKLGECIVLDWYPEALDSVFGGDPNDDSDLRGHFLSDEDGKHLPFVHDPATEAKRNRRELRKKHGITLEDCFMETGKREKLSEDNAWYCNRCKELRQATKTLEIWTCPDIVVVHLKRFGGTRSFRDKIDVLVDYPIEGLDLTEKIGQREDGKKYIYDLFAVDNHFGGLGGGHYTACAKNFFDGQWYDYNDSMTSKLGDSPRKSAAAYLLFYRRRSDKPLGPQYLQDLVNDFRNPPQQNNSADESYESDSGEGRLGDPSSTLRGSSSNSIGAGAGASRGLQQPGQNTLQANGNGSAGQQAGRNLRLTSRETNDDDEAISMDDDNEHAQPSLLNNRQYGNFGNTSWGFAVLDAQNNTADTDAEMLLDSVEDRTANADNDADSNAADGGFDDNDADRMPSLQSSPGWNDLDEDFTVGAQQAPMYSGPHTSDAHVDALHLEDAGMMHSGSSDPPAVEITLPDDSHAKMD